MDENPVLDRVAALLVCLVIAVSVLYPQNFITGVAILGSESINPLTIALPLIGLGSIVYLLRRFQYYNPGLLDILVVAYTGYLLVRNITGDNAIASAKYIVLGIGIFYITALLAASRKECLWYILYTIVGLTLVTAGYGLVEYTLQENIIYGSYVETIVAEPATGIHRIGSSLGHPVPYGAFLLQALPFAVLLWFISKARWQRALALTTLFTGALALFLTYSKGSWIVAVVLVVVVIGLGRGALSRKFIGPAIIMAILIAAATAFFWTEIREEIEGRTFGSVDVRLKSWQAALDGIAEHPLLGVGLRQGSKEIVKYVDSEWLAEWDRPLPVDNYYLNIVLEGGIIGAAIWLALVFFLFWEVAGLLQRKKPPDPWALAALVSFVGILLNAVTFEALHIWPNFILFWVTAGILHGLSWRSEGAGAARWRSQKVP